MRISDWSSDVCSSDLQAEIRLADGGTARIPMAELTWARKWIEGQRIGYEPKQPGDVLQPGQVVLVEAVSENDDGEAYAAGTYGLRQIPKLGRATRRERGGRDG